jgi:hypothetical protein
MLSLLQQMVGARNHVAAPPRPYRNDGVRLTDKQHNHNIKLRAAAAAALERRTNARYTAAFDGGPRTITDLKHALKISRQGVMQQLRKYAKAGKVERVGKIPGTKEVLWVWVP